MKGICWGLGGVALVLPLKKLEIIFNQDMIVQKIYCHHCIPLSASLHSVGGYLIR